MANNTEDVERILRFNCPEGCDGKGSYPEMGADGEWEQGQCQWCFEYGMPARDAIQSIIRTEKLKLLAEVRERVVGEHKPKTRGLTQHPNNAAYWTKASQAEFDLIEQQLNNLYKLEAEL